MIRPFLLTAGSRGDVEPYFALSAVLSVSPKIDQTTLCIPSDYMHMAPVSTKHFTVVPLKFSLNRALDYIPAFRSDVEKNDTANRKPEVESSILGLLTRDLILPDTKRVFSIAEASKCTVVVTTGIAFPIAHIISEKLQIPMIIIHLQPLVASRFYPHVMVNAEKAAAALSALHQGDVTTYESDENFETHVSFIRHAYAPCIEAMNKERSHFNLAPTTVDHLCDMASDPNTHAFTAVQSQLIPRAPDTPANMHIVGSLATAFLPKSWDPEKSQSELTAFLRYGPPPTVVSYGSMEAQGAATGLMRALLTGMINADVERVVIMPGKADLGVHHLDEEEDKALLSWAKGRVFETTGNVQFSWLLPQCEMFFSHCGAGSTSAALHAGIPILGTPLLADQIFFAELVKRRQLGQRVGTIGLPSVTSASVSEGIARVRTDAVRAAVRKFSEEQKRLDESVEKVVELIEQISSSTGTKL